MDSQEREDASTRPALTVPVGTPISIRLTSQPKGAGWWSRVVGYLPGVSVLVTTPRENGTPVSLLMDDTVAVRYFAGRDAHGFTSWVRKVCLEPFPYLHLAYPETVERVTIRKEHRVPVDLAATCRISGGEGRSFDGRVLDLSPTGALFTCAERMGEDDTRLELELEATFAGQQSTLKIPALVRNVRPEAARAAEGIRHGLQFETLEEQTRLFLSGFVYETMLSAREG